MSRIMRRLSHRLRRIKLTLLLLMGSYSCFSETAALDPVAVQNSLNGPVRLSLQNGSQHEGTLQKWDGETLRLRVEFGAGSADMSFESKQIKHIKFPGETYLEILSELVETPERSDEALSLFRAFYQQRGAYLQFLTEEERALFVRYADFALAREKPLRAVAVIELLRPHVDDEALLSRLNDSILLAFALADMIDEATIEAKRWIETTRPGGDSALGWRVMARLQFKEKAFEEALWTSLIPIAYSNQMPTAHLNVCYAYAIAAAAETRQPALQARLEEEMLARQLNWPQTLEQLRKYQPEPQLTPAPASRVQSEEEALGPIQTPSPIDPVKSLPTRLPKQSEGASETTIFEINEQP